MFLKKKINTGGYEFMEKSENSGFEGDWKLRLKANK